MQINCLLNKYNVVIPRSILLNTISMLKTNIVEQFEPIPTLRLEAMRGSSIKTLILQLNCLFNNYNVVIRRPIVFGNIDILNIKEPAQFGTIPILRLEAMRG